MSGTTRSLHGRIERLHALLASLSAGGPDTLILDRPGDRVRLQLTPGGVAAALGGRRLPGLLRALGVLPCATLEQRLAGCRDPLELLSAPQPPLTAERARLAAERWIDAELDRALLSLDTRLEVGPGGAGTIPLALPADALRVRAAARIAAWAEALPRLPARHLALALAVPPDRLASQLDPATIRALSGLASVDQALAAHGDGGRLERWQALARLLDEAALRPAELDELLAAAEVARQADQLGEEVRLLTLCQPLAPTSPRVLERLAAARLRAGDVTGAGATEHALAAVQRDAGRLRDAIATTERALRHAPREPAGREWLMAHYLSHGPRGRLTEHAEQLLRDPATPARLALLERALAALPDTPIRHRLAAQVHLAMARQPAAEGDYRALAEQLEADPGPDRRLLRTVYQKLLRIAPGDRRLRRRARRARDVSSGDRPDAGRRRGVAIAAALLLLLALLGVHELRARHRLSAAHALRDAGQLDAARRAYATLVETFPLTWASRQARRELNRPRVHPGPPAKAPAVSPAEAEWATALARGRPADPLTAAVTLQRLLERAPPPAWAQRIAAARDQELARAVRALEALAANGRQRLDRLRAEHRSPAELAAIRPLLETLLAAADNGRDAAATPAWLARLASLAAPLRARQAALLAERAAARTRRATLDRLLTAAGDADLAPASLTEARQLLSQWRRDAASWSWPAARAIRWPLHLRSVPTATVWLDGLAAGRTPCTLTLDPARAPWRLALQRTGYATQTRRLGPDDPPPAEVSLRRVARWSAPAEHVVAPPALTPELVLTASRRGALRAHGRVTGALRWQARLGPFEGAVTAPVATDALALTWTLTGSLHAVALVDGALRWRRRQLAPRRPVEQSPIVAGDRVLVVGQRVLALRRSDGADLWAHAATPPPATGLALLDDRAWYADTAGALIGLRLRDGEVSVRLPLPAAPRGTPVASGDRLLVPTAAGLAAYALDPRGRPTLRYLVGLPGTEGGWAVGRTRLVACAGRALHVHDAASGSSGAPFALATGGTRVGRPTLDDDGDQLLLSTADGQLHALDLADGRTRWRYAGGGTAGRPAVDARGLAVVAAGRVHVLDRDPRD